MFSPQSLQLPVSGGFDSIEGSARRVAATVDQVRTASAVGPPERVDGAILTVLCMIPPATEEVVRVAEKPLVWNTIFAREGLVFPDPHEDMPRFAERLQRQEARTVLDLGCGTGRHVLLLAECGLQVSGVDNAPAALAITRKRLEGVGLTADLQLGDIFDRLPYADGVFDGLVSTQVIHHARIAEIAALVQEIGRIVRPGGLLFVTVPRLRNQATEFALIEPGTYLPLDGREAGLPHHFFSAEELVDLFTAFKVLDLHEDVAQHYCLTAERSG
jgi:SAM-dependent methyltransferase